MDYFNCKLLKLKKLCDNYNVIITDNYIDSDIFTCLFLDLYDNQFNIIRCLSSYPCHQLW